MSSQHGIRIDGRMNVSCVICAGTLPTIIPRLNQVFIQFLSFPYRLKSSCIPETNALPVEVSSMDVNSGCEWIFDLL